MGPTIIIGLGGVGSEITAMTEERLRSIPPDSCGDLGKLLQFAVVDTDVNALRERQRTGFQGTIVQISDNMTVERYLHYDHDAKDWFPPCQILSRKTLTEGAGQVRAVSRLALNLALQKQNCMEPLYDAIDRLHLMSESNSEQPTRVVIISSLAGGTGSGIFLPLAMHLQEYLKRHYRNTEPIFKGFFIMPSFFEPIAKGAELRSLNSNGYAAIKELNAFTLMQDQQIRFWQYPDMKIELQNGHEQVSTYTKSPYDLCFLFEKQDQDDKHLRNFEESKRNVANCIWMQTVNPLLEQNCSLEDNLFKIVFTANRDKRYNRFAGMGIAQMIYPYKKMEGYFSSVMAYTVVNLDWYAADTAWIQFQQKAREEEGQELRPDDEKDFYISFVEGNSEWGDLAESVRVGQWAQKYVSAVEKLAEKRFKDNPGNSLNVTKGILDSLTEGDNINGWSPQQIVELKDKHNQILQEQSASLISSRGALRSLLWPNQDRKKREQELQEHQIEYWLKKIQNPAIHRYFLALVIKELAQRGPELEERRNSEQRGSQDFRSALENMKDKTVNLFTLRFGSAGINIRTLGESMGHLYHWHRLELQLAVYEDVRNMVENLWGSYKALLRDYATWIDGEKQALRKNLLDTFESKDGQTTRFVCASENCLTHMEQIVKDSIYIRDYGMAFAQELYREAIQQYQKGLDAEASRLKSFWTQQFARTAGKLLDVDVLSALENEARWEYERKYHKVLEPSDPHYNATIAKYMEDEAFQKVHQIFVRAFLRIPNVKQRHTLEMCIYPPEIPKENALLQRILTNHLVSRHGLENFQNDSERKYHIDFYRAVFGVSASEISAFLFETENSPVLSGDAHMDYQTVIRSLDWIDQGQSQNFLTPHIDRRWHKTTSMPELSQEYGRSRTIDLLLCVLYGLVSQNIYLENKHYRIKTLSGHTFDRFDHEISNLYQLVDFVDESPAITAVLLEDMEQNKQNLRPKLEDAQAGVWLSRMIEEYCRQKLTLESIGKDEVAEIMAQTLMYLTHASVKTDFRREAVTAKKMSAIIDKMTASWTDDLGIKNRMIGLLDEEQIKQWLDARNHGCLM